MFVIKMPVSTGKFQKYLVISDSSIGHVTFLTDNPPLIPSILYPRSSSMSSHSFSIFLLYSKLPSAVGLWWIVAVVGTGTKMELRTAVPHDWIVMITLVVLVTVTRVTEQGVIWSIVTNPTVVSNLDTFFIQICQV